MDKIVKRGLAASPLGLVAFVTTILMAGVIGGMTYRDIMNEMGTMRREIESLKITDKVRDEQITKAVSTIQTELTSFRAETASMRSQITEVQTSIRFLVEAQRRRPND